MRAATSSEIEHEIGSSGRFILHVRSTDVRLHGVSGGSVRLRGKGVAALRGVHLEPGPGQLTVTVRSGHASDVEIDVPMGAAVTADGSSSDIEARGLHGNQRYRTASGDLRLRGVRGSITVEAVSGDIDMVVDGTASILARTVSGELSIRAGVLEALRATTTSGDVHLAARFAGPGPFGVETVSGDVTLAPADGIRVVASTITGDVRSDLPSRAEGPRSERSLVVGDGDGGATITFRSMSGDLRVVRAMVLTASGSPVPGASVAPAHGATGTDSLEILRALERGDIDVDEADRRLEALDGHRNDQEADHG